MWYRCRKSSEQNLTRLIHIFLEQHMESPVIFEELWYLLGFPTAIQVQFWSIGWMLCVVLRLLHLAARQGTAILRSRLSGGRILLLGDDWSLRCILVLSRALVLSNFVRSLNHFCGNCTCIIMYYLQDICDHHFPVCLIGCREFALLRKAGFFCKLRWGKGPGESVSADGANFYLSKLLPVAEN